MANTVFFGSGPEKQFLRNQPLLVSHESFRIDFWARFFPEAKRIRFLMTRAWRKEPFCSLWEFYLKSIITNVNYLFSFRISKTAFFANFYILKFLRTCLRFSRNFSAFKSNFFPDFSFNSNKENVDNNEMSRHVAVLFLFSQLKFEQKQSFPGLLPNMAENKLSRSYKILNTFK